MADKFVKMSKEGETIEVNPLCVDDHKRLGWAVFGETEEAKAEKETVKAQARAEKETAKG